MKKLSKSLGNIVLFQPEIPPNTGNIARFCVCNNFRLHLIHPLGFAITEKQLKRAGMDYWEHLDLEEHSSWSSFEEKYGEAIQNKAYFFSAKSSQSYWQVEYPKEPFLIFGSETRGLPGTLWEKYQERFLTLPMYGDNSRCLNLSSSACIAGYEVLRQLHI